MIERPQQNEAAAYYFTYINQVTGTDGIVAMESQLEESMALFSKISEANSQYSYGQEKWTIRQVLNHITDTEAFAFRALWFARGFKAPLPGYDQDVAASFAGANEVSWEAHVEEFQRVRLSTISLYRNLPSEALMRSGIASENSFTVRALAYIIVGHVAHHVSVLHERYLSNLT
jgi:uncharacterized damage-inducible protein DinB